MSLALAEILWRGDGNVSVDRLRQGQSHHGLTLSWSKNSLSVADLFEIKARPHVGAQGRNGTFDVWHKLTRENPIVGKVTDRTGENHRISAKAIFFGSTNRLPLISNDGISLEQLYAAMPRLSTALGSLNLQPKTVRATVEDTIYKSDLPEYQEKIETTLTVHPGNIDCINKLKSQLAFIPRSITDLIIVDGKDHFRVTQTWRRGKCGSTGGFDIPDAISIGARTTYFKPFVSSLNEFGIIYVTCFVLGNLCRYYPDLWMNELERHSGFSYLAQEFLTSASDRLPLVALATLTDSVYIQNDIGLSV